MAEKCNSHSVYTWEFMCRLMLVHVHLKHHAWWSSVLTSCYLALLAERTSSKLCHVRNEAIDKGSEILHKFPFSTQHFKIPPHLLSILLLVIIILVTVLIGNNQIPCNFCSLVKKSVQSFSLLGNVCMYRYVAWKTLDTWFVVLWLRILKQSVASICNLLSTFYV